jgi:hypothetical protein
VRELRVACCALLLVLAACPLGDPDPWTDDADFPVELGVRVVDQDTGEASFVPLENGDDLPLERGFQGGQHFQLAALTDAVDANEEIAVDVQVVENTAEGPRLLAREDGLRVYFFAASEIGAAGAYGLPRIIMGDRATVGHTVELRYTLTLDDDRVGRVRVRGPVALIEPF